MHLEVAKACNKFSFRHDVGELELLSRKSL